MLPLRLVCTHTHVSQRPNRLEPWPTVVVVVLAGREELVLVCNSQLNLDLLGHRQNAAVERRGTRPRAAWTSVSALTTPSLLEQVCATPG